MPILGVSALEVVRSVVELKVLGALGSAELDAVITINQTFRQIFMTGIIALAWGASAIVAQRVGAQQPREAGRAMGQTLGLALVLAVGGGVLANTTTAAVLRGVGLEGEVAAHAGPYLRLMGAVLPASLLFFVLMSTLQAAGDVVTPFMMVVVTVLVQVIGLAIFPFGAGPVPAMGVLGVVVAAAGGSGIAFALGMARIRWLHRDLDLHPRALFVHDWGVVRRIMALSWPVLVQISCRAVMLIVMMRLLGGYGASTRAGYGVALRIDLMLLSIGLAFTGAAATVTGQNMGAQQPDRAARGAWIAWGMYTGVLLVFTVLFQWQADAVIGAFSKDPDVVAMGARYLRISSAVYPFLAAGFLFSRAMQGAGDMLRPMWAMLFSTFVVFVPLAMWLPGRGGFGAVGLFYAAAAGTISGGLIQPALFIRGAWRQAYLTSHPAASSDS